MIKETESGPILQLPREVASAAIKGSVGRSEADGPARRDLMIAFDDLLRARLNYHVAKSQGKSTEAPKDIVIISAEHAEFVHGALRNHLSSSEAVHDQLGLTIPDQERQTIEGAIQALSAHLTQES